MHTHMSTDPRKKGCFEGGTFSDFWSGVSTSRQRMLKGASSQRAKPKIAKRDLKVGACGQRTDAHKIGHAGRYGRLEAVDVILL